MFEYAGSNEPIEPDWDEPLWPSGPSRIDILRGLYQRHVDAEWPYVLRHMNAWASGDDDALMEDLLAAQARGEL